MIKESIEILKGLYPDKQYIQRAKSDYSMYISGQSENFIIGVTLEEDKIYFCSYRLNYQPKNSKVIL